MNKMPEQNNDRKRIARLMCKVGCPNGNSPECGEYPLCGVEISQLLPVADWHISELNSAVLKARKETAEEIFDCTYDNSYIDKLTGETEYSKKCKEIISDCDKKMREKK